MNSRQAGPGHHAADPQGKTDGYLEPRSAPLPSEIECDVVVVGGGIGGTSAALRAVERGRSTVLLERGASLGGTAIFSGGWVHVSGAKSWEGFRDVCPDANPRFARRMVESYEKYVRWLEASGAPGSYGPKTLRNLPPMELYELGSMVPEDHAKWFNFMEMKIQKLGGRILKGTRGRSLVMDGGKVAGVEAERGVERITVRAEAVILAAGGFQNAPDLLGEHVGLAPENGSARSVSGNVGDGLRMALAAGARTTANMKTVYGHLLPAPPCRIEWGGNCMDPALLSVYYADHGILVNANGERFVDEGMGEVSGAMINAAAQQPPGGLWMIMDEAIRRRYAATEFPSSYIWRPRNVRYAKMIRYFRRKRSETGKTVIAIDAFRMARDHGALVIETPTVSELTAALAQHGVDAERLCTTIAEFNQAADGESAADLEPPKLRCAHPIERGPFYALKVVAGISMTYGGVEIDEDAHVLDESGNRIANLYAVPGTAGGIYGVRYGGSLAACGVYGMIAGQAA